MITDITPAKQKCGLGSCPAMFKTGNGTYIVVGKRVEPTEYIGLDGRVGPDEAAVEVPVALVDAAVSR